MNYKIVDINPISWKIVKVLAPVSDDCFASFDEARNVLIETCEAEIKALQVMITEIKMTPESSLEIFITPEQMKGAGKLSDLFSKYIKLEARGDNYISNCPYCKTSRSFIISDRLGIYKCLACDQSGDIITFFYNEPKLKSI
jgi:CHC2 zinc finger